MRKRKGVLRTLFMPPPCVAVPIMALGFGAVLVSFALPGSSPAWDYIAYPWSAYATALLCVNVCRWGRSLYGRLEGNPMARRFVHDSQLRSSVSLSLGTVIHALYTMLQGVLALVLRSGWQGALFGYHAILTLMQLVLFRADRRRLDERRAWQWYGVVGALLIPLAGSIQVLLVRFLLRGQSFSYPGFMIYATAAYSFYSLTAGGIQLIRRRTAEMPLLRAALNVRFSAALMSMLALQTALISTFGEPGAFQQCMNTLTGSAVCMAILTTAIWMLKNTHRYFKDKEESI